MKRGLEGSTYAKNGQNREGGRKIGTDCETAWKRARMIFFRKKKKKKKNKPPKKKKKKQKKKTHKKKKPPKKKKKKKKEKQTAQNARDLKKNMAA